MSKATKRKHVTKEAVDDYFIPEGDEEIVKIFASRGNNLHEVENASGEHYLVSMPNKFRKNIWVKRGDFVVTVPIKEGNKVQGEIVYILLAKQIKYLKDEKHWPEEFSLPHEQKDKVTEASHGSDYKHQHSNNGADCDVESEVSSSEDEDDLPPNPNHRPVYYMEDTSDEETTDEEDANAEVHDEVEPGDINKNNTIASNVDQVEEGIAKVKLKVSQPANM